MANDAGSRSAAVLRLARKTHRNSTELPNSLELDTIDPFKIDHNPQAILEARLRRTSEPTPKVSEISHWVNGYKPDHGRKMPRQIRIHFEDQKPGEEDNVPKAKNSNKLPEIRLTKMFSSFSPDDLFHDPKNKLKQLAETLNFGTKSQSEAPNTARSLISSPSIATDHNAARSFSTVSIPKLALAPSSCPAIIQSVTNRPFTSPVSTSRSVFFENSPILNEKSCRSPFSPFGGHPVHKLRLNSPSLPISESIWK